MNVWIKICGITTYEHAEAAAAAGADAVGFVFAPSKRRIEPELARDIGGRLPARLARVGVVLAQPADALCALAKAAGVTHVQVHGPYDDQIRRSLTENGFDVIWAQQVRDASSLRALAAIKTDLVLLDTYDPARLGGTGRVFDWRLAAQAAAARPVILAGGLRPDNVAAAIRQVGPYGVDVSSGVETLPGVKDPKKIKAFVDAARSATQAAQGGSIR